MYNLVSFSIISSNSRVCQQNFFNSLAFIFTGLVNYPNIFTGLMNYHKVPQLIPGIMCFLAVFCGLIWVGQVRGVLQRGSLTYIWNNLYSFKLSSVLRWILMKKRNLADFHIHYLLTIVWSIQYHMMGLFEGRLLCDGGCLSVDYFKH